MSKERAEDTTSLGNILLELELVTKSELERALQEQERLSGDELLGKLLIANGACTEDEIATALSAQASLRATGRTKCAMAVADLAIERRRRKSLVERRQRMQAQAESITRSITSEAHPAITPAMLAKHSSGE